MIATRRKVITVGQARAVIIPAVLEKGPTCTLAGNRLLLLDPRGEVPADDLLEFMEKVIEPALWPWLDGLKGREGDG